METFDTTISGIIAVCLDVRIENVLVFHSNWVCLHPDFNTYAFGHCILFWGKKVTASLKVAIRL